MRRTMVITAAVLVLFLALPASARNCYDDDSMYRGSGRGYSSTGMYGCCAGSGFRGWRSCGGAMGGGICMGAGGCGMGVLPMLEYVDLTDSQWERIDEILLDAEEQVESAREEAGLYNPSSTFVELFASEDLTVDALEDFAERSERLGTEMAGIHNRTLVRVHDVLTEEQLDQLASMAGDEHSRFGRTGRGRHGYGHMHGRSGGMGWR